MQPRSSYVICTTARSGSHLLSTTLAQTGVAGRPSEFFIPGFRDEFIKYAKLGVRDYREYLQAVIEYATTPNGVAGFNLHAVQAKTFMTRVEDTKGTKLISLRQALETAFPDLRYIFLTRKDKTAQAISHYRAVMTKEWMNYKARVSRADKELAFNQYGIKKCLEHIKQSDAYWEKFFSTHADIAPLRLTYEGLAGDHIGTMRQVFEHIGLPSETPVPSPMTKKVANERSKAWAEEFLRLEEMDPVVVSSSWSPQAPF